MTSHYEDKTVSYLQWKSLYWQDAIFISRRPQCRIDVPMKPLFCVMLPWNCWANNPVIGVLECHDTHVMQHSNYRVFILSVESQYCRQTDSHGADPQQIIFADSVGLCWRNPQNCVRLQGRHNNLFVNSRVTALVLGRLRCSTVKPRQPAVCVCTHQFRSIHGPTDPEPIMR